MAPRDVKLNSPIFTFGGATFHGSAGDRTLSAPVVSMTSTGNGYYFAFGDAPFTGTTGVVTSLAADRGGVVGITAPGRSVS